MKLTNTFKFPLKELLLMPEFIYFLGFIWADGSLQYNTMSFEIQSRDFEEIKSTLETFLNLVKTPRRQRERNGKIGLQQTRLSISDKSFSDFLYFCYFNRRKDGQSFEILLNYIEPTLHKFFIHGYFDGDGSVGYCKSDRIKISIASNYNQDWTFLQDFFLKNEISSMIYKKTYLTKQYKSSALYIYRQHDIRRFFELINSHIEGLKRKKEKLTNIYLSSSKIKDIPKTSKHRNINLMGNSWIVVLTKQGKRIYIGSFETEEIALKIKLLTKEKSLEEIQILKENKFQDFLNS